MKTSRTPWIFLACLLTGLLSVAPVAMATDLSDDGQPHLLSRSGSPEDFTIPSDAEGEFLQRRRQRETRYLEEIDSTFSAHSTQRIPLMEEDVVGLRALREIGQRL